MSTTDDLTLIQTAASHVAAIQAQEADAITRLQAVIEPGKQYAWNLADGTVSLVQNLGGTITVTPLLPLPIEWAPDPAVTAAPASAPETAPETAPA